MSIACGMAALPPSIGTGDGTSSLCSSTTQCRKSPLIVTTTASLAYHQLLQMASPPPTSLISASSKALRNVAWLLCKRCRAASLAYTAAFEVVYLADLSQHNLGTYTIAPKRRVRPGISHLLLNAIKSYQSSCGKMRLRLRPRGS